MNTGMDLEVGYSLEYEYSVTQLPPGDYSMLSGGTVGQCCEPSRVRTKVETLEWHLQLILQCFRLSLYFWVYDFPSSNF